MNLFRRAASCLLAALFVASSVPTAVFAEGDGQGGLPAVPEDHELVYFVDCGATSFSEDVQNLINQYPDSVQNSSPDQQYFDGGQTWGYTNSNDSVMTYDGSDAYESLRCFKEDAEHGVGLRYHFACDAGTYQVSVGLYDPWAEWNKVREATVFVNDNEETSQYYKYSDSGKGYLTFSDVAVGTDGLTVRVAPTNGSSDKDHDVLVSFIMITRQKSEEPDPTPEQPAMPDENTQIWGKGGEAGKLCVEYQCANESLPAESSHNTVETLDSLSGKYFVPQGEMTLDGDVWVLNATVNGEALMTDKFQVEHTQVTVAPEQVTLEYVNEKWCIRTEEGQDQAKLTVAGTCASTEPEPGTPAAPELGVNLKLWIQLYTGEYGSGGGMLVHATFSNFKDSIRCGEPYQDNGQWKCEMTVIGYTEDEALADSCYGNRHMLSGCMIDPYELDENGDAINTVTLTYNEETKQWECPAISRKKTSAGPNDSTSATKYGVAFKVCQVDGTTPNPPALPPENPIADNGFSIALYEMVDGQPVVLDELDYNAEYVELGERKNGGWLKSYEVEAAVDPAKALTASGLSENYVLVSQDKKVNKLAFDWDTMTWQPAADPDLSQYSVAIEVKKNVPTPEQPDMPDASTSIWGKDGQNWKFDIIYRCTNSNAAHQGGNEQTRKVNFISGKYFAFGEEMRYDAQSKTWQLDATVEAETMMEDFFKVAHPGAACEPAKVTLACKEGTEKWYILTDAEKAVLTVSGACEETGPVAPELGENVAVWVQLYSGEYGAVSGQQIDRQPSKYKNSVTFGEPVQGEDGQWTCDMTVTCWTDDSVLAGSCYGNLNMQDGYEMDPCELRDGTAAKTVTLTYNQNKAEWECPAISIKKTSHGPGESNPKTYYGVAFKIRNIEHPDEDAPSLPVENPVQDGGFWVTLYENTGKGNQEVFTKEYDGTQEYINFSEPVYENNVYSTIATVDPAKLLEASGLTDYVLVSDAPKASKLTFDWDAMAWTAQEMQPGFTQPDSTAAKRGMAFEIKENRNPGVPTRDNCSFMVTVYTQQPKDDGSVVNTSMSASQWYTVGDKAEVTFAEPVQDKDGTWTCTATINAQKFVDAVVEEYSSNHIRRDETDPATKTITLTYNENSNKWIAPEDGVVYGPAGHTTTRNGVAFRTIQQYTVTYVPGRDLTGGIPTGDEVYGGAFDKGAVVDLPETTSFVTENGVFAGWRVSIKEGSTGKSTIYFYPIGTDMTMFGRDVEAEAYWMNVELEVASVPYDAEMNVKDYTFGKAAEFSLDGETVTLLYRATVQGNSQYPYTLLCDGAEAVYDSAMEGAIDKYQASKTVYFTKTYTPGDTTEVEERVAMGNASDTVALRFHQDAYTIAPSHTSIYTGGEAYTDNHGLPEDYDLDGLEMITSITIGEETIQYTEEEQEDALGRLKSLMTVDYRNENGELLQDDKLDGEYVADLRWVDQSQNVLVNGSQVNLEDGVLIVRPVTDPGSADEQQNSILFVLESKEPTEKLSHAVAVAKEDSVYYINNDTGRVLDDATHVSLLDDSLLTEGNDNRRILMEARGDETAVWGNESPAVRNQYEFHYLDLVDPQQGNMWVASSKGVTVYLPYPEGTDKTTEFMVLHYKDLHREYGIEGQAEVEEAIRNCEVEKVSFSKEEAGLRFEVGQSGFSPFAIVWQTENKAPVIHASDRTIHAGDAFDALQGVTANDPEDGDISGSVSVKSSNVNKDQAGRYTVTYQVADRQGAVAEATITVTVQARDGGNTPDPAEPSGSDGNTSASSAKPSATATPAPAPTAAPSAGASVIPQTGDSLPVGLLGGMAGLALLGLVVLAVLRKSKKQQ